MNADQCDVCDKTSPDCRTFKFRNISHTYCAVCLEELQNGAVRRRGQSFVEARLKEHGLWCRFKNFFTK